MASSVKSAQAGNIRVEWCMESKLLDLNFDKSCYMILGSKHAKKYFIEELRLNPLKLCGKNMKNVVQEKLLGDVISSEGLCESVTATVNKRKGQVLSNIVEIRAVIDDFRSKCLGGIITALEIWELAILPFLLYNCETWTEISPKTVKVLNELQLKFYRIILATPRSCPIPALMWETGGCLMEHRIAIKKIMFFHHLKGNFSQKRKLLGQFQQIFYSFFVSKLFTQII